MKKAKNDKKKQLTLLISLAVLVTVAFFACLFVGSANMSLSDAFRALFGASSTANNRIVQNIRLPRVIAALVVGAGLAVAGLVMQTCLNNPMASPSTLGVSNAAVFGANLSFVALAGGFVETGKSFESIGKFANPFAVSAFALTFSVASVLLVLALCRLKSFSPSSIVLAGISVGAVWTAATTILQYFATDVGLSAAVVWSFGDLGRVSFEQDALMATVVTACIATFFALSWKFNAMLGGDVVAKSVGVRAERLRVLGLLAASLTTAVCVSFVGVIGFVGIICPHFIKRIVGSNHVVTIPASALAGSLLLLVADALSRSVGNGSALPVGAITSILGAPFFVALLFAAKERN